MGIAGCGVVIVREDLIADHKENIPVLMEYNTIADNVFIWTSKSNIH